MDSWYMDMDSRYMDMDMGMHCTVYAPVRVPVPVRNKFECPSSQEIIHTDLRS